MAIGHFLRNRPAVGATLAPVGLFIGMYGAQTSLQIMFQSYFQNARISGVIGMLSYIGLFLYAPFIGKIAAAMHSFFPQACTRHRTLSLGLVCATALGYDAALKAQQTAEVALNMRYLTAGAYLLSALLQLIAYGLIYNLDKKTLSKMQADLK